MNHIYFKTPSNFDNVKTLAALHFFSEGIFTAADSLDKRTLWSNSSRAASVVIFNYRKAVENMVQFLGSH